MDHVTDLEEDNKKNVARRFSDPDTTWLRTPPNDEICSIPGTRWYGNSADQVVTCWVGDALECPLTCVVEFSCHSGVHVVHFTSIMLPHCMITCTDVSSGQLLHP